MSKNISKIALLIMAIVIVVGMVITFTVGANYILERSAVETVMVVLNQDFESSDIENAFKDAGYKSPIVMEMGSGTYDRAVVSVGAGSDASKLDAVKTTLSAAYPEVELGEMESVSAALNTRNSPLRLLIVFAASIAVIFIIAWIRYGLSRGIALSAMVLIDTLFAYSVVAILRLGIPAGYEGAVAAVAVISLLMRTGLAESFKRALFFAGRKAKKDGEIDAARCGEKVRIKIVACVTLIAVVALLILTNSMLVGLLAIILIGTVASALSTLFIAPELEKSLA